MRIPATLSLLRAAPHPGGESQYFCYLDFFGGASRCGDGGPGLPRCPVTGATRLQIILVSTLRAGSTISVIIHTRTDGLRRRAALCPLYLDIPGHGSALRAAAPAHLPPETIKDAILRAGLIAMLTQRASDSLAMRGVERKVISLPPVRLYARNKQG